MNKEELDKMYAETGMQMAIGMCAYGPTSNNHWLKMSGIGTALPMNFRNPMGIEVGTALPMNFRNPMGIEVEDEIKKDIKDEIVEDLDELAKLQKQQICSTQDSNTSKFRFNIKLTKL